MLARVEPGHAGPAWAARSSEPPDRGALGSGMGAPRSNGGALVSHQLPLTREESRKKAERVRLQIAATLREQDAPYLFEHGCGGLVRQGGGLICDHYRYCEFCEAFDYTLSGPFPTGTDLDMNHVAWFNNYPRSPDEGHIPHWAPPYQKVPS